jgi:ABC-type transporter Mla subunit MlaD
MSAYRKNVLVGVTVLVGLIMLGWMLLKFGGGAAEIFVPPQIPVQFVSERADGLGDGSAVQFRGVVVGRVTKVTRSIDNNTVVIDALIDRDPPLPSDLVGLIRNQSVLGSGTAISLERIDDATNRPTTQPFPKLAEPIRPHQQIRARFVGNDLLPPEFADLAKDLKLTSQRLRESNIFEHADQAVLEARNLIQSVQQITNDPKMRDNLNRTMANLADASDKATRIATDLEKFSKNLEGVSNDARATINKAGNAIDKVGSTVDATRGHVDELSRQMSDRMTQIAKLLDTFQSVAAKVDAGKGTAGQLVNDPRLYENLVDTTRQLNLTITDLKRLVEQWEQEGIYFKLGK